jgi:hypothetical protein
VFNFLCEVMASTALIFGALMMYARRDLLTPENRVLFQSFEGKCAAVNHRRHCCHHKA